MILNKYKNKLYKYDYKKVHWYVYSIKFAINIHQMYLNNIIANVHLHLLHHLEPALRCKIIQKNFQSQL